MRTLTILVVMVTIGLAQSKPVVLSRNDIGDNYEAPPDDLPISGPWLGLFGAGGTAPRIRNLLDK